VLGAFAIVGNQCLGALKVLPCLMALAAEMIKSADLFDVGHLASRYTSPSVGNNARFTANNLTDMNWQLEKIVLVWKGSTKSEKQQCATNK
jgi:hypothetical protein